MEAAEDVFDGPAQLPPAPPASGQGWYRAARAADLGIRHVSGYAPFLTFCTTHQTEPRQLAGDLPALVSFLREHTRQLQRDTGLSAAATVFVGNTLVSLRPDARWETTDEGITTVGTDDFPFVVAPVLDQLRMATPGQAARFVARVQEWAGADPPPVPALPPVGSGPYLRPPLPVQVFRTPEGQVIPYGNRWGEDGAPEEAYSVVTHPERFTGLHTVAAALIDHLAATYDVTVEEDPSVAQDLTRTPAGMVRATRLTPRHPQAAPLTIVLTDEPGVIVHAGALYDLPLPDCDCDACDQTVEGPAEELEQLVLAVAGGGLRERYPVGDERFYEYAWTGPDGDSAWCSPGEPPTDSLTRLQQAEKRLAGLPHGWRPWPPSVGRT
ncbi:hypothetical protein GCM10011374_37620 [Kocuria dechangensis]|uniref:Uncharacterized protein n=1 Tax=Kocuria dechangensis TaxID=1176249 RepID=A0A917H716_9MICC|nr:DUF6226 family protein [Kocuria dechangensis]GGG69633.1 hypothetical protein GCM10011374_37620 [Kocuria dechangensis]